MDDDNDVVLRIDLKTGEVQLGERTDDEPYMPPELPPARREPAETAAERERRWMITDLEEQAASYRNRRDKAAVEAAQFEKRMNDLDPIPIFYEMRHDLMTKAEQRRRQSHELGRTANGLQALADRLRTDPNTTVADIRSRIGYGGRLYDDEEDG